MKICIEGRPIAKQRPRFVSRGNFTMTYDPLDKEKKATQIRMKKEIEKAMNSSSKLLSISACQLANEEAFEVIFWFFLPVPESDSKPKRNSKLWGFDLPAIKPDYDNLEKFYLDCANGILFPDDAMIVDATSHKRYSSNPRVEIEVMPKKSCKGNTNTEKVMSVFSPQEFLEFINDAKKIVTIDAQASSYLEGEILSDWLEETASKLSQFAIKHAASLKKISSMGETKSADECKAALQTQERFSHGKAI